MRKTWWIAVSGIVTAILTILTVLNVINSNESIHCSDQILTYYQNENEILFQEQKYYAQINDLHTLIVSELIRNNSLQAENYRNDTLFYWGLLANLTVEKENNTNNTFIKYNECLQKQKIENCLLNTTLFLCFVLIFINLKAHTKTKE